MSLFELTYEIISEKKLLLTTTYTYGLSATNYALPDTGYELRTTRYEVCSTRYDCSISPQLKYFGVLVLVLDI